MNLTISKIITIMEEHAKLLDYTFDVNVDKNKLYKFWSRHYYEIVKLAHPFLSKSSKVLEVGYGYGVLAKCIKEYHADVTSLEHPSRSDILQADFIADINHNNIHLVLTDILKPLPFQHHSFDLIFMCDVIEHIDPAEARNCLEKVKQLLKPRGKIILTTPNLRSWGKLIKFIKGEGINPALVATRYGETFDHIREFMPSEIENIATSIQMKVDQKAFWPLPFFDPEYETSTKYIGSLIPSLLDEFALVLSHN